MSASKHINKICLVILAVTLVLLFLFMNGQRLGIQAVADADAENYNGSEYFTANDLDGDWDATGATEITLAGDSAAISGNGAYVLNGDVVIAQSGRYRISGELDDGSIIVDTEDFSKVWILFDGVSVYSSDDAALRIDEADKTFLTLAKGSENSLAGGAELSEEALADGTGGAIYAHDDLTINGSGSLAVTAEYQHGIEANDELTITGGALSITAAADGIQANEVFAFTNASLTISTGDDGIHSDSLVYIQDGAITIDKCYEGIEGSAVEIRGGSLEIRPSDDGINASGTAATDDSAEEETETGYILIEDGDVTIVNGNGRDADGLDSNGDVIINGGTLRVFLNGDGGNNAIDVASEYGGKAVINGGSVIACGGASMVESIDASSAQVSVMYNAGSAAEGETVALRDAQGNELLYAEVPCAVTSVLFSCPAMQTGETYTVAIGETTAEVTLEETSTTVGGFGGMAGQGQMPREGGMPQNGDMPQDGEMPQMSEEGGRPQMQGGMPPQMQGQFAGNAQTTETQAAQGGAVTPQQLLLVGVCAAALLAGLLVAGLYKKR